MPAEGIALGQRHRPRNYLPVCDFIGRTLNQGLTLDEKAIAFDDLGERVNPRKEPTPASRRKVHEAPAPNDQKATGSVLPLTRSG